MKELNKILLGCLTGAGLLLSSPKLLAESLSQSLDLSEHWVGYLCVGLFAIAYLLVVLEEVLELRKSKPMMLAAALIWVAIALVYKDQGMSPVAETAIRHDVLDYGELLLFLIVSIAYINAMEERRVFDSLRAWLVNKGLSYRQLFWVTGVLAFFISSVSNNMTTAMLMCAVVMAVGKDNPKFVGIACVNTVVAANAGGAFCPFGDITTLMVWQKGIIDFWAFFKLFVPSVLNFLIPAAIMHFAIPKTLPAPLHAQVVTRRGAKRIVALFLLTVLTAVGFQNSLHMPAAVGMMAGLTYLQFFGYFLHITHSDEPELGLDPMSGEENPTADGEDSMRFDVFHHLARMEWDTLLFFYGVVLCVGGMNFLGYLRHLSEFLYGELGATPANVLVGLISALIDNIPVMFAILAMRPEMSEGQWLLVTLTAGVGGSLLSVGSAAGVALMGQAKGIYTFMTHLKWTPVIALGYLGSVAAHFLINSALF
ncbi:sodium:proton antiporter [Methylomonas sp. Kb3]|uniref:sodium:proton antiporter NhaD n=1 Tax=Methylomonas sp. Kb3 TaxID=1611544 RepID=UPI000C34BC20|nr:sodium:proton antiporter NhaD [Methylomonas sp. Kb3]PKD40993.1 sodium:proton antiporter [Methylomonas sp. Kb3]